MWACSKMHTKVWSENLEVSDCFENLGWMMINLAYISYRQVKRTGTSFEQKPLVHYPPIFSAEVKE